MIESLKESIIQRANSFLDQIYPEVKMIAIYDSLQEHKLCYSVQWCQENEFHLAPENRTLYCGARRILISKSNKMIEFEPSAPFVDWIHKFELKTQGLEEYPVLTIDYSPKIISGLKMLLGYNTPEILKQVNPDSKIELEDEGYILKRIKKDLDNAGIPSTVKIQKRKTSAPNNPYSDHN